MKNSDPTDPEIVRALEHIALWIKQERLKARLSQMELSLQAGLSINHIFSIETGTRFPNMSTFLKICKALNLNPAKSFVPVDEERLQDKAKILELLGKYL